LRIFIIRGSLPTSTSYGDEIVLFDDKLFQDKKLIRHIVPVKENETLDVGSAPISVDFSA
jgi:hypothetical protein